MSDNDHSDTKDKNDVLTKEEEYEFLNEDENDAEEYLNILPDNDSWIRIANSLNERFFVETFTERARETTVGGTKEKEKGQRQASLF